MTSSTKHSAEMQRNGFMKDSFGFKMSKKVAELTQVVHMLFSRNHEREVELDSLRATYEEEVSRLIKNASSKIEKLEYLLRDATRQRQRDVVQAADNTALLLQETQEKMESMKQDLVDERSQTIQYRDLLSQTQKELERARQGSSGVSVSLEQTTLLLHEKENELVKLKTLQKKLQDQYKINERELEEAKMKYRDVEERLFNSQNIIARLNKSLEESNRRTDELSKKLLLAEEEAKAAKREVKKRSQNKNHHMQRSAVSSGSTRHFDKNEEIENMRKEIERLRMEISNREGNFNRVFAKFQPVVVSPDAQRMQQGRMMMVTPSFSDSESRRHFALGSSRPFNETPFLPKTAGSNFHSNYPLNGHSSKLSKSYSHSLDPPRLNSSSRNGNTQFRLVYTK